MRIAIVTDAWEPQVNGVVTTLTHTRAALERLGYTVGIFAPGDHPTVPCPTYPEIRLAIFPSGKLGRDLDAFRPDAVHVATEGPLGAAARRHCIARGRAFTTSYHTQFPQYVRKRLPVPLAWTYAYLRRHHGAARRTLVATERQRRDLIEHGFDNVVLWPRGVDTATFRPLLPLDLSLPRPIFMYAGRVAVEKNLEAFLDLDLPGAKVVVGDGPDRGRLEQRYSAVRFVGYKFGAELAAHVSAADVFVFPSKTDTFGLVMLEALACGVPVAAYPVTGPADLITPGEDGVLADDLREAALAALDIDRQACRRTAQRHSWRAATQAFLAHLVHASSGRDLLAAAADSAAAEG